MKRILLIFAVFFVTVAGIYYWRQTHLQTTSDSISTPRVTTPSATKPEPTEPPLLPSNLESITTNNVTVPLDVVPGSYTALVSRDYLLPSTYVPKDLVEISVRFSSNSHDDKRKMRRVASKALSKMFRAAEKKGIILYGVSVRMNARNPFTQETLHCMEKKRRILYPQNPAAVNIKQVLQLMFPPVR